MIGIGTCSAHTPSNTVNILWTHLNLGVFFFRSSNDEFKWKSPNGGCMCARENLGRTFTGLFFGGGGWNNNDREKSSTPFAFLYQTPHKKPGPQSYIKSIYPRPRVPPAFGTPARLHACEKILIRRFFFSNKLLSITAAPHRPGRHMRQAAH